MRTIKRNTFAALAIAGVAVLGLAGCSGGSTDDTAATTEPETSETTMPSETAMDPAADLVGSGCAAYAEAVPDGAGSVEGMSLDPVATAASNNPILTTLTAAVSGGVNPAVNLVDTLNGSEFTVFAPVDDAFAKIPAETINTLATEEGGATLTSILTYHVVPGQISPDDIDGTHTTVNGADLTVSGSGDNITVNDSSAVICGGVKTANATVYLIDTVLMPPM
ncbi:MAG: fasciclin domain-containing protein [Naasia sp.]